VLINLGQHGLQELHQNTDYTDKSNSVCDGMSLHIVHNTAGKAGTAYEEVTGFNIEDLVIDLFYWFQKSTRRKVCLSEYCTFCDVNYREVVKHVNTRWLSLERAVGHSSPWVQRLHAVFSTPMTEVYLLFYQSALQTFVHFNMFLQREDPLLPVLCQQMDSFLSKLASKFLPPSTIKAANRDFSTLNYM